MNIEKNQGPRVTLEDIHAAIASEHYFTARDGVLGADQRTAQNESTYESGPILHVSLRLLTFCVLVLKNGFTVTGKNACVSAENFDANLGRKYALENAIEQCWPLFGFALADSLHREDAALVSGFNSVRVGKVPASSMPVAQSSAPTDTDPETIARVCHEVNRAYCAALGDMSQPTWKDAPAWQRASARMGVDLHTMGEFGPEASHLSWTAQKLNEGWVYGPVKAPELKQHPCIVPFADLPREQQAKDFIFRAVVHALRKDPATTIAATSGLPG